VPYDELQNGDKEVEKVEKENDAKCRILAVLMLVSSADYTFKTASHKI
jgi:hypothetical protein